MLIGYARISKADGSQSLHLKHDALIEADVGANTIYKDRVSGKRDTRPGLDACLKALREGDVLAGQGDWFSVSSPPSPSSSPN